MISDAGSATTWNSLQYVNAPNEGRHQKIGTMVFFILVSHNAFTFL